MRKSKTYHPKRITLSASQEEYDHIIEACSKTTCRSVSEYCRTVLAGKPITVYYRNKAFDEFIETGIQLKKRLDTIVRGGSLSVLESVAVVDEIQTIKEMLIKIYDHVNQTTGRQKHRQDPAI